jgi:hypothetical protein
LYKKLQLNKTNAYELAIGTRLICEMLVDFIGGKCKYKSLSREQGDVPQWDDFILTNLTGNQTHFQIKENNHDLDDKPVIRDKIKSGLRKGQPSGLSPFDKSLESLGVWFRNNPDPAIRKTKQFIFVSPYHKVAIKENLSLTALTELCNEEIKAITDVPGLQELAKANSNIQAIYGWLTTWCEFSDWKEVLDVLSHLKVKNYNSTDEIIEMAKRLLEPFFSDVPNVLLIIQDIITTDNTFTTSTPAKYVLDKIRSHLLPDLPLWSKYHNKQENLYASTIEEMADDNEFPAAAINGLWDSFRPGWLYLDIPLNWKDTAVCQSLIRICLHLSPGNRVHASQADAWKLHMAEAIGKTLGNHSLDEEEQPIFDAPHITPSSIEREIDPTHLEAEAESLSAEMSRLTWNRITARVSDHLRQIPLSLRTELNIRWTSMKAELETAPAKRDQWLRSMMHPKAERRSIRSELRVGPATAPLLAKAILYQLAVLAALEAPVTAIDGFDETTIQTLALRTWSGPMESERRVYELAEKPMSLLGKETCSILILPQVPVPREYLRKGNLASDGQPDQSLAAGNQIKLEITTVDWQQWIEDGNLDAIKNEIRRFIAPTVSPQAPPLTV